MLSQSILSNFVKIIQNNSNISLESHFVCNDLKYIKNNNLLTIYKENSTDSQLYDMHITVDMDYQSYDFDIIVFYVPDVYVAENMRGKKVSFYLFYNLCLYLINKYPNNHIFLILDDCSGYDYKSNIYAKLGFYVEQDNDILVTPEDWTKDEYNDNPNEMRYGYVPLIIKIINKTHLPSHHTH